MVNSVAIPTSGAISKVEVLLKPQEADQMHLRCIVWKKVVMVLVVVVGGGLREWHIASQKHFVICPQLSRMNLFNIIIVRILLMV